ncbi:hypothetical protein J2T04_001042 [Chryseobacterium lathyri]|uniref:Uncharacterized protein n=1 Tax=Chryseobacterium lathyri TaxID=395933 RepID=A0ABT9SI99_9FLAO|nr:hypothetical protein [Chryseobacterium lathyri]
MALINNYRNSELTKKKEQAKLISDKAKEH